MRRVRVVALLAGLWMTSTAYAASTDDAQPDAAATRPVHPVSGRRLRPRVEGWSTARRGQAFRTARTVTLVGVGVGAAGLPLLIAGALPTTPGNARQVLVPVGLGLAGSGAFMGLMGAGAASGHASRVVGGWSPMPLASGVVLAGGFLTTVVGLATEEPVTWGVGAGLLGASLVLDVVGLVVDARRLRFMTDDEATAFGRVRLAVSPRFDPSTKTVGVALLGRF